MVDKLREASGAGQDCKRTHRVESFLIELRQISRCLYPSRESVAKPTIAKSTLCMCNAALDLL
jgi:hypothetical protein